MAGDSGPIATVFQSALVKAGYKVLLATDGLEALKIAMSERPKLSITDSDMPETACSGPSKPIR